MWMYRQVTGELTYDGVSLTVGYSGNGKGLNNPAHDLESNVGPIPKGYWTIGDAFSHPKKGRLCMRLTPKIKMHRSGFMIHGDNANGDKSASQGCIIFNKATRDLIANSEDKLLMVF